ncbi:hypothetical protein K523DRAFT_113110 [Schizophyllum commune Tattone D]|nr:hypothetical protein K523DRAFT_113110 [Schizophyllum commune Tattone D]
MIHWLSQLWAGSRRGFECFVRHPSMFDYLPFPESIARGQSHNYLLVRVREAIRLCRKEGMCALV